MNKKNLRCYFKNVRLEHNDSVKIRAQVLLFLESQQLSKHIGIYWPLTGEADLRPLKAKRNYPLALPVSDGAGHLRYFKWDETPLQKDGCGIPAPLNSRELTPCELSLLLVPALAIDQKGFRLGYGGGYYDRLLCKDSWKNIPVRAVLPSECISKSLLPKDPWDQPFDGWISEKGTGPINSSTAI